MMKQETKYTMFDEERNTLYINSDVILPKMTATPDMNIREFTRKMSKRLDAFKLSYEERIEKFASPDAKEIIKESLAKHSGCKISEYSN